MRAPRVRPDSPIILDPLFPQGVDWVRIFGNDHPVEVEIGPGKAGFLLRRAQQNPQRNFLGIERASKPFRWAVDRMERWNVTNVRLVRADASHFMCQLCPRGSLSAVHVYHPDPWPKKRHHKRRLFQPAFVDAVAACLVPGGRLAVQTDHAEYFEVIRGLVLAHPDLRETAFDEPGFGVSAARVETNYEIKYLREGRRMYQLAVRRVGN